MRKVIMLLALTVLLISPALADNISVPNVTADMSFSKDYGGVAQGSTLTITLNLPFTLSEINSTGGADYLNITADSATASTTVNLTVNNVAVLSNYVITGGATKQVTFADFAAAGVDMNATKLTIAITAVANNTVSDLLVMDANDALMSANFTVKVTETLLNTPQVNSEAYVVRDNISITQDSDVNLTDVNATLSYPSFMVSKDVPSYYNFGSLNTSETKYTDISYQKKAPYVVSGSYSEKTNEITTTLKIYSYENLTAEFAFIPTSKTYSKWFPGFSKSNIESIKLNGNKVSWKDPSGQIVISNMNLKEGYNTLTITYAKAVVAPMPVLVTTPTPWYLQPDPIFSIPVWFWMVVAACIVLILAFGRRR